MKHRLYLYLRNHLGQIKSLEDNVKSPLGWVFTGWKIPINELDRDFCKNKLKLLFDILKEYSETPFSIHMEIKVYRKDSKDYGFCYLHFHVVCGRIRNLKKVRNLWNRQVKYEVAIFPKNLGYYVSKYASKSPVFDNEELREYYHCIVYKLQMHRYSIKKIEVEYESMYISMDSLKYEVKGCLYRDSWLNPNSKKKRYFKFLENNPPEDEGWYFYV